MIMNVQKQFEMWSRYTIITHETKILSYINSLLYAISYKYTLKPKPKPRSHVSWMTTKLPTSILAWHLIYPEKQTCGRIRDTASSINKGSTRKNGLDTRSGTCLSYGEWDEIIKHCVPSVHPQESSEHSGT